MGIRYIHFNRITKSTLNIKVFKHMFVVHCEPSIQKETRSTLYYNNSIRRNRQGTSEAEVGNNLRNIQTEGKKCFL